MRTSQAAVSPPTHKLDDGKKKQPQIPNVSKSTKDPSQVEKQSTNIYEGFFTPNPTNKIGYMTVKDRSDKSKKEAVVGGPAGTLTNDSFVLPYQNLDISAESKKFLNSRYNGNDDVINMEKFGYEQFILGQQQLQQKHLQQQKVYREEYEQKLLQLQARIEQEIKEKDRLKAEAAQVA